MGRKEVNTTERLSLSLHFTLEFTSDYKGQTEKQTATPAGRNCGRFPQGEDAMLSLKV